MNGKRSKILGAVLALILVSSLVAVSAQPALADPLTNLSYDVDTPYAGATATHTIGFTTASALPAAGEIRITFPSGFDVSGVTDEDVTVTGPTGGFDISINGQTVIIARDGTGDELPADSDVTVEIENVVNATTSGAYHVTVGTYFGGWIDGPNDTPDVEFKPSASFDPDQGPCGTTTTVNGVGWEPNEYITGVKLGTTPAAHTLSVSNAGALSGTITIPYGLTAGTHDVTITGSESDNQTFASAFTVTTATASFNPSQGPVGTVTEVSGSGWVPSDTIASVTVGGVSATHTLSDNASGALSGTITIPSGLTTGAKTVVITGQKSGAQSFASAFTVTTATASFNPSQGPVGTVTTVSGSGWVPSDTITSVTVGGRSATHTLSVNASGALSGTITIPSGLTTGAKTVVITGQKSRAQTFASAFTVTTSPTATFTPNSATLSEVNSGVTVTVSGSGWVPSDTITSVTVGGESATSVSLSVNASGALSGTFGVPTTLKPGTHNVVITGQKSGAQTFEGAFKVLAEIELCQGWNLISLPVIPNSTAIGTVLSSILDDVESVWYYSSGTWKTWSPGVGGNLTTIEDGKAYWIKMTQAATLTVDGKMMPDPPASPPSYSLSQGWNMLGYKSTIERETINSGTPLGYLNSIEGKYSYLVTYKCDGGWEELDLDDGIMEPGQGYWIYMTESGNIPAPEE